MTTLPLLDCSEMLTIDPKTLRHWLRQAGIPLQPHPTDARVKCLTMEQVQALAALHGRALKSHPTLPSGSGASTSACGEPQPLTSPASPSEADLHQKLASLEAQVTLLHHQLAHLTSVLLGQQTSVDPPRAWLAALVPPTGPLWPCSAELAQKEGISQVVAGPRPHPAENRRRRLLPLIEYGAHGTYVVICPQEGELHLSPDSPEWFAWLASVSSFRFVGKCGRFTACRVYDKGPTRSWQAHRVIHQRHYKPHLGVTEHLTIDCLEQAAARLQSYVDSRSLPEQFRVDSSFRLQTSATVVLPPFPVPGPGATRCCTVLLCYACCVPMGPAAHNGPSPSCPCTCRHCTGKRQGKVDGQVATTRIRKLSCCQNVIAPLSEE